MSQLDDLVELMRSANDVYLINPTRNVRMAYIIIDNLCELAIKIYLQMKTRERQDDCLAQLEAKNLITSSKHYGKLQAYYAGECDRGDLEKALGARSGRKQTDLQSILARYQPLLNWSSNKSDGRFKSFPEIIQEIKDLNSSSALHDLLDEFDNRRSKRNDFFHNPDVTGLTVSEEECLRAFCDLYDLMDMLFDTIYRDCIAANQIVKAQVAIIRLRLEGFSAQRVREYYNDALRTTYDSVEVAPNTLGYEYRLLYSNPQGLYSVILKHFEDSIYEDQAEIDRIDDLKRKTRRHRQKKEHLRTHINMLQDVVDTCLS